MKNLIMLLLLTCSAYSQKQVFNVQQYCIDEMPLKKGECDISGNEYSFLFLDVKEKEVVFFLTEIKIKYQIIDFKKDSNNTVYRLKSDFGETEMKVNNAKTKIEIISPDRTVFLTVGKSTKL